MQRLIQKVLFNCVNATQLHNRFYGTSSQMGGSSTDSLYARYAGVYQNVAMAQFKRLLMMNQNAFKVNQYQIPGATIITTVEECKKCVEVLLKTNTIIAWDTETMDLDIKNEAPVGRGKIICASFFGGPQYNFGNGPRVFIDNFGKNAGLIDHFKEYLQDEKYLKVWHNYGFDRHVFHNHGINVRGFGGDTMHMARLYDSGKMFGQYSLSALTKQYAKYIEPLVKSYCKLHKKQILTALADAQNNKNLEKIQWLEQLSKNIDNYQNHYIKAFKLVKTKMDDIFRRKRILKSGGEGASYEYPKTITLHTNIQYLKNWVQYSLLDSEATFYLRETLQLLLLRQKSNAYKIYPNMWLLYRNQWRVFGEILTDIERNGIKISIEHMKNIQKQAQHDLEAKKNQFLKFLLSFQFEKNVDLFNPSSALQLQQLIHAPYDVQAPKKDVKDAKNENSQMNVQEIQLLEESQLSEADAYEPKAKGVRKAATLNEVIKTFKVDNDDPSRGNKKIEMKVKGLGIPPEKFTPLGMPSVDESVLQILAGDPKSGKYGKAFKFFEEKGDPQFGKSFCQGLRILIEYRNIETLVKNFIMPLRGYADQTERIHCSLNLNTETGRLSCKKPNLQNQPALEKDIYKIRKAFIAEKGNKLIVSDYGQLELRVLAHLTDCKAMIKAFKEGGDFHSRTAIGMFDYIKKEIQDGTILLEWDKSKGPPPVQLLKDKYAAQRKKAKTVNFSIAYGKTAKGFADDWSCSLDQAKKVIKSWFSDRPEVQRWQKQKQDIAEKYKYTQTLLGRFRKLDKFFEGSIDKQGSLRGMRMRRAINTPVQGGAADIVIAGMINICKNKELEQLGWKLLMQIHDQLILEGPQSSAKRALEIVKYQMEHPFEEQLRVAMEVDAKIGDNWYQCK